MLLASAFLPLVLVAPGSSGAQDAATPAVAATPIPGVPSPGAAGIGDQYYPLLGNGGYDAIHYAIDLDLDIEAGSILDATTTIDAECVAAVTAVAGSSVTTTTAHALMM